MCSMPYGFIPYNNHKPDWFMCILCKNEKKYRYSKFNNMYCFYFHYRLMFTKSNKIKKDIIIYIPGWFMCIIARNIKNYTKFDIWNIFCCFHNHYYKFLLWITPIWTWNSLIWFFKKDNCQHPTTTQLGSCVFYIKKKKKMIISYHQIIRYEIILELFTIFSALRLWTY